MKRELIDHDEKVCRGGRYFRVRYLDDDRNEAPWENDEGTGIVSDWERRDKLPGERVLSDPHGRHRARRFYDWAGTMAKAKADGWGLSPESFAELRAELNAMPTPGQVRERSVQLDFERLQGWCNDEWRYVGVVVQLLEDEDDYPSDDYMRALWGIGSDEREYLTETAEGLIGEILSQLADEEAKAQAEAAERLYWESRDVVTV